MNFFSNKMKMINDKRGLTLIEIMVSIALFSIVIVVIMGSIITIIDVNRKSQTLSIVMNDLNFVLESMTRSAKTGDNLEIVTRDDGGFSVINQDGEQVEYVVSDGKIKRSVEGASQIDMTSDQINISGSHFKVFDDNEDDGGNMQPRLLMSIEGEAKITESISSAFRIQTTVSQRDLDDEDINHAI